MHDSVDSRACRTLAYGALPDQVGDLYLPNVPSGGSSGTPRAAAGQALRGPARRDGRVPVICLLHGGFWRLPYGREHVAAIAVDLARRGFAVWNLEYRRVGAAGGGWPGTLDDVAAGIDHVRRLADRDAALDPERVLLVGHSAGGHLALWAARRFGKVRIAAAAGLAAVADLRLAHELRCGNGAVADFLGGSPEQWPARYHMASPAEMLPLGVRQLLVHGTHDADVPIVISRSYAAAAAAAGDDIRFVELPDACHMDAVDPASAAHAVLCGWLDALPLTG